MKYFIGACILTFIYPLSVYSGGTIPDTSTEKTSNTENTIQKKQKTPIQKPNVKKDVKELKPNIAEEYKPLIAEYDKYWKFIRDNDLEGAYGMETDEYKKVVKIREYKGLQEASKMPVSLKAVRALEVQKKDEKEVIVKGTMWLLSGQIDTLKVFDDTWIMTGNGWRHVREIKQYDEENKKNS